MKQKTCKNLECKIRFTPDRPMQTTCSQLCAAKYSQQRKRKNVDTNKRIKPKTKHKNSNKSKGFKDPAYLSWLHNDKRPCCIVCGSGNIELHHVNPGLGNRDDREVVPLCPDHHRGKYSPHGFDSKKFYYTYPKDFLLTEAKFLYSEYKLMEPLI